MHVLFWFYVFCFIVVVSWVSLFFRSPFIFHLFSRRHVFNLNIIETLTSKDEYQLPFLLQTIFSYILFFFSVIFFLTSSRKKLFILIFFLQTALTHTLAQSFSRYLFTFCTYYTHSIILSSPSSSLSSSSSPVLLLLSYTLHQLFANFVLYLHSTLRRYVHKICPRRTNSNFNTDTFFDCNILPTTETHRRLFHSHSHRKTRGSCPNECLTRVSSLCFFAPLFSFACTVQSSCSGSKQNQSERKETHSYENFLLSKSKWEREKESTFYTCYGAFARVWNFLKAFLEFLWFVASHLKTFNKQLVKFRKNRNDESYTARFTSEL